MRSYRGISESQLRKLKLLWTTLLCIKLLAANHFQWTNSTVKEGSIHAVVDKNLDPRCDAVAWRTNVWNRKSRDSQSSARTAELNTQRRHCGELLQSRRVDWEVCYLNFHDLLSIIRQHSWSVSFVWWSTVSRETPMNETLSLLVMIEIEKQNSAFYI